jgi:hypothetical protein
LWLLLLLLGLLLLLLLLLDVELGRGVEAMALRAGRGPRVGELGRVTWVGHVVEVEGAAEALLVVDGHGGHLRDFFEGGGKQEMFFNRHATQEAQRNMSRAAPRWVEGG